MTNPTDRDKLEPCPFCGGEDVKTFGPYGWYLQWGISHSCKSFYSGSQEMFQGFPTEAEAIAAWNRRATTTPQAGDALTASVNDVLREALERWQRNLAITQGSPVMGDTLHGAALDFVIEQIDGILALSTPTMSAEDMREALEWQMENAPENQDEDYPSSLARERGLVWLEGWFDLRSLPLTKEPTP